MPRVVGIDPGTKSFDFFGLDGDTTILDKSILTKDINEEPEIVAETIKSAEPTLVVGPSGYGVPLTRIEDLGEEDLIFMTLTRKDDKSILGLRRSIDILKKNRLPVFFIPGVIHLPTVPAYRKLNKIDLGTPDKVCCAALAIRYQADRLGIGYAETSFILLEMGYGFTAAIGVDRGEVVDGIGGTSGCSGFLSPGALDLELAILLGGLEKETLFRGGIGSLLDKGGPPEKLFADREPSDAWHALLESAVKDVLMLTASILPKEILISGRLTKIEGVLGELSSKLGWVAPLRRVRGFPRAKAKEAAQGAALIADGLMGGKYRSLVDTMRIREARGTCLDYIRIRSPGELKKKLF